MSVFLDHMAYLFPDEAERAHVLDYLALTGPSSRPFLAGAGGRPRA